MILCVGNSKGGVGKSTIAVNLAVAASMEGKRVLLIDADPQASTAAWRSLRSSDDITCMAITTPTLHKDLPALIKSFDMAIIDVGGRDTATFRSAILAADMLLIPVLPSQFDIFAAGDTVGILREARVYRDVQAAFVLNQLIPNTVVSREATEALQSFVEDAPLLDARLFGRVAYKTSLEAGQGVLECEPGGKAALEVKTLYGAILEVLS